MTAKYTWYEVRSYDGSHGLMIRKNENIDDVRQEIDEAEKRAVAQGYSPEKWIIVKHTKKTHYEQGIFEGSEEYAERVEFYPNK